MVAIRQIPGDDVLSAGEADTAQQVAAAGDTFTFGPTKRWRLNDRGRYFGEPAGKGDRDLRRALERGRGKAARRPWWHLMDHLSAHGPVTRYEQVFEHGHVRKEADILERPR